MAFTPNSVVYLLDTPLDNTYKNQLYFSSLSAQQGYFKSVIKHSFNDVTYQRKDNSMRVRKHIDDLWNCNYVMYQNANFSNKWFYAFITKMEYVNENTSEIFIETDVYQTWLFNCTLKDSFVIREHVMNDAKGQNLVDEGLEIGEYKLRSYQGTNLLSDITFVVALTMDSENNGGENLYGEVYSGLTYYAYSKSAIGAMADMLETLVSSGKGDAVQFIFTIPSAFLSVTTGKIPSNSNVNVLSWDYTDTLTDIDGYTPKNNKLFNYPYNLFYVSNNQGSSAEYRFEDFGQLHASFKILGCISPNPTIMLCPQNYKGQLGYVQEYGLSMGGYPLCSWSNDVYGAWLAQNSASLGLNAVSSALQIGVGAYTGNVGMASSGAMGAFNQMAQIYQHSIQPPQARGNTNGGTVNTSNNRQDFFMSHMTIKKEFAQRIDDFFTMYGYKVNTVKVPNVSGRPRWNYVQTVDINIDGAIPSNDMRRLKQMYNEGVTLWKSVSYFGDYSGDNNL
jgi:hypothetical protein